MPERKTKSDYAVDLIVRIGLIFLAGWLFMLGMETIGEWIPGVPGIGYWRAVWLAWIARALTQYLINRHASD